MVSYAAHSVPCLCICMTNSLNHLRNYHIGKPFGVAFSSPLATTVGTEPSRCGQCGRCQASAGMWGRQLQSNSLAAVQLQHQASRISGTNQLVFDTYIQYEGESMCDLLQNIQQGSRILSPLYCRYYRGNCGTQCKLLLVLQETDVHAMPRRGLLPDLSLFATPICVR